MPKAERAIIMAAGLGNRMHPVTLTTQKPLVKVNGVRMIDTVIEETVTGCKIIRPAYKPIIQRNSYVPIEQR